MCIAKIDDRYDLSFIPDYASRLTDDCDVGDDVSKNASGGVSFDKYNSLFWQQTDGHQITCLIEREISRVPPSYKHQLGQDKSAIHHWLQTGKPVPVFRGAGAIVEAIIRNECSISIGDRDKSIIRLL